jgi:hypothetical protein
VGIQNLSLRLKFTETGQHLFLKCRITRRWKG